MPNKIRGNVYKRAVRLALLYGSECWPMRRTDEQKIHLTEMKMRLWRGGVSRKDKMRNDYIRGSFKVATVHEKFRENRLRWYGHVMRRYDDHMSKRVMNIEEGKKGHGRPPITWLQTLKNDLKTTNISKRVTHNHTMWRKITRSSDHN
ncbi:unnamed protein product [Parnassius apollo]|uniref:(apollo) hypothetical protein n=1 Tax=Parnassius apollo TaxID=110799 RepID=A0A8S3WSK7_PARAO|nr:unnamed protein product [Parnassius apollo]